MSFRSSIDVRPPYYALTDVELRTPGLVSARVRREHPLGHEVGPLAAAEAGRHLAIVGSCACSSVREPPGIHYYLAQRARLVSLCRHTHAASDAFVASATSVQNTTREAVARAVLQAADGGESLYELEVSYRVMSQALFARVFAAHRRDLRAAPRSALDPEDCEDQIARRRNPYQELLPLEITQRSSELVQARLGLVTPDLCAGHFPQFPALPVAVLMHALSTLCGEALRARWGQSARYRVLSADVVAERLAFAGESLRFLAAHQSGDGSAERYQARAMFEDGTVIGSMDLDLEPIGGDAWRSEPSATTSLLGM